MSKYTQQKGLTVAREYRDDVEWFESYCQSNGLAFSHAVCRLIRNLRETDPAPLDFESDLAAMSPDSIAPESKLGKPSSVVVGSATPTS